MLQSGFATHVLLALCMPEPGDDCTSLNWYVYSKEIADIAASDILVSLIALDYLKGQELSPGLNPIMNRLANVKHALVMPSSWNVTPQEDTTGKPFVNGRSMVITTTQTNSVPQVHTEKRTFTEVLVNLLTVLVGVVLTIPKLIASSLQWRINVRNGTFVQKNMSVPPKKKKN